MNDTTTRSGTVDYKRVLHLSDVAFTGSLLQEAANTSGRDWRVLPLARSSSSSGPLLGMADKAVRGALWEGSLLRAKLGSPRVHVHSALARRHAGWAFGSRFALHLHGTDIRTRQYEAAHRELMTSTVRDAHVVFYSTPDLREHVIGIRPDARLVPVPVPLDSPVTSARPSPVTRAVSGRDYIFFPSRWDDVKGGEAQIELARTLARALPGADAPALLGLNWGPHAAAAADAGVTLIPKLPHEDFLAAVAGARMCIGQLSGVMGASELDVLAADVPLLAPLHPGWYDSSHPSLVDPPVLGGRSLGATPDPDDMVDLIRASLESTSCERTRPWVEQHHSPKTAFTEVLAGYRETHW